MLVSGALPLGRSVELVIFDCDGVLIDSEVLSTRSTVAALGAIGYEIGEAEAMGRFVGRSYASIRQSIEADWGKSLPNAFEAEVEKRTLDAMARSLEPIAGIEQALSKLDLPRCVASSSSVDWITRGLKKTGILGHLEPHLFSASMVENGKPAPDIFLYAAQKMGVTPTSTLVVEDSVPGVQAGAAAGTTVVGFTGGSHVADKRAHGERLRTEGAALILDDMAKLQDLLAGAIDR